MENQTLLLQACLQMDVNFIARRSILAHLGCTVKFWKPAETNLEHATPLASEAGRWNHHSSVNTGIQYRLLLLSRSPALAQL